MVIIILWVSSLSPFLLLIIIISVIIIVIIIIIIAMLNTLEEELKKSWYCKIKSSSRTVQNACASAPFDHEFLDDKGQAWQVTSSVDTLGALVSSTGSSVPDLEQTETKLRAAFFRNHRLLTNSHVTLVTRAEAFRTIASGVVQARAAAWQPSKATYDRLDSFQNEIVGWLLRLVREPGEDDRQYSIRRNREIGRVSKTPLSLTAATAAVSWASHMLRHLDSPAALAWKTQGPDWISERRAEFSSVSERRVTSRTRSRTAPAYVHRWDPDGWVERLQVTPDDAEDSAGRKRKAETLLRGLKTKTCCKL